MDKVIQLSILWKTSQTAGRTCGETEPHLLCLQKGIATAGESICFRAPRKSLESSQNILEKRSPSTPRVTGLLVATSGRAPGAWPRGATGNRLRADLQGNRSTYRAGLEKSSVGSPHGEPGPAPTAAMHSIHRDSCEPSLQHLAAASVKEFCPQYWRNPILSGKKKINIFTDTNNNP